MVFKFILLCVLTELCIILGHILIDRFWPKEEGKKGGLLEMWKNGELKSDVPLSEQLEDMASVGPEVEVEWILEDDLEEVDIERAKIRLAEKNASLMREVVLEL